MNDSSTHDGCEHDFDVHVLIATGDSPTQGGIMLCPVKGCECFSTWDAPQVGHTREAVIVPPPEEITRLREQIQK